MEDKKVIKTKLGDLEGLVRRSSLSDKLYYSFIGIPFAKPPLGILRFKDPKPFGGWTGVRDATQDGNKCKQGIMVRSPRADPNNVSDVGDEDCLYLCVHTPKLPEEMLPRLPVMVYIHGGALLGGSGTSKSVDPDLLLEGDVVLVTINYRCGAFGFLSLENDEVPGNAGLKDQTLALRWVQDNIDSFGGDPGNVTIFGVSAGGASVHYHLLSPLSRGLFHKAILQSGFCLNNEWAFQRSPKMLALRLAKMLGCRSDDPAEVLMFLQTVPSEEIVSATHRFCQDQEYITWAGLVFSPCVEVEGSERFLLDSPANLMSRGEFTKVPTIMGIVENEGSIYTLLSQNCFRFDTIPEVINNNPELIVPPYLGLSPGTEEHSDAKQIIWDFYFKGEPFSLSNYHNFTEYESDLITVAGFGETRKWLLENSPHPVFTYLFTNHTMCICSGFPSLFGPKNPVLPYLSGKGTCHTADSLYMVKPPKIEKSDWTPEFTEAVLKHVKAWTKFAKDGHPTVEESGVKWDGDSESRPCYMEIGTDWVMREGVPFAERINFWLQLRDKYSNK